MKYVIDSKYGVELTSEQFAKASGLFDDLNHHLSIKGVFSGDVAGRVFLSNDEKTAFISNKEGFFVGGCPENIPFLEEINKVLAKEMMPELVANEALDYVLFYPNNGAWETALQHLMEDLLPIRSGRMTFTHDLQEVKPSLDADIVPVNLELLKQQHIIGMDDIIEEIEGNWPSLEAFGEKGFGCAAIQNTAKSIGSGRVRFP